MNISIWQCIKLSFHNLICKKKYAFQVLRNISIIMIVIILYFVTSVGINNIYNKIILGKANSNNVSAIIKLSIDDIDGNYITMDTMDQITSIAHVMKPVYSQKINITEYTNNSEYAFININRGALLIDKNKYNGVNDNSYNFNQEINAKVKLNVDIFKEQGDIITEQAETEFNYYYPNQKIILKGKEMTTSGEIMISEYMLSKFGITNYDEIIGKSICILVDDNYFLKDVTVTAVINSNYFRLENQTNASQIMLCGNESYLEKYKIEILYVTAPIDDFAHSSEVYSNLQKIDKASSVEYDEQTAQQYFYISRIKEIVNYVTNYVLVFILIALFLNITSILSSHLKNRSSYYGMMRAMGFQVGSINLVIFFELIIISFFAFIISLLCSIGIISLINQILYSMIYGNINIAINQYIIISAGTFILVITVLIIISLLLLRRLQQKEIISQIKEI